MSNTVTVLFPVGDPFADEVLQSFLLDGSSRRPRLFQATSEGSWQGEIRYGQDGALTVPIEILRVPNGSKADWCVSASSPGIVERTVRGKHHFTLSPWKIASTNGYCSRRHLIGFRMIPNMTTRNAANELSAAITRQNIDEGGFLAFPGGDKGEHRRYFESWVRSQTPIRLISACCLHANEDRRGIANELDPTLTGLLARVARASLSKLPQVTDWRITTFGPGDYDWLGELGITKVLLPYMWDAPRQKVVADLEHNLAMTEELTRQLDEVLPFPVSCEQMHQGATRIDMDFLVRSSQDRARQMMPKLQAAPPAIFRELKTPEEQFARVQQEAFLYLYDTIRHGQVSIEKRTATLYVGLEVHGGYWQHGDLFVGPDGEFLPLVWLPQAVRQHWAPWATRNHTLNRERERIQRVLAYYEY